MPKKERLMADARMRLEAAIRQFENKSQQFTLPMLIKESKSHRISAFRNSDLWEEHPLLKTRGSSKHDAKQKAKIVSALETLLERGDYVTMANLTRESGCGPSVLLKHKDVWKAHYLEPNTVSHSPLKKEARIRISEAVTKLEKSGEKITLLALCKLAKAGERTVKKNRDLWCHINESGSAEYQTL